MLVDDLHVENVLELEGLGVEVVDAYSAIDQVLVVELNDVQLVLVAEEVDAELVEVDVVVASPPAITTVYFDVILVLVLVAVTSSVVATCIVVVAAAGETSVIVCCACKVVFTVSYIVAGWSSAESVGPPTSTTLYVAAGAG